MKNLKFQLLPLHQGTKTTKTRHPQGFYITNSHKRCGWHIINIQQHFIALLKFFSSTFIRTQKHTVQISTLVDVYEVINTSHAIHKEFSLDCRMPQTNQSSNFVSILYITQRYIVFILNDFFINSQRALFDFFYAEEENNSYMRVKLGLCAVRRVLFFCRRHHRR